MLGSQRAAGFPPALQHIAAGVTATSSGSNSSSKPPLSPQLQGKPPPLDTRQQSSTSHYGNANSNGVQHQQFSNRRSIPHIEHSNHTHALRPLSLDTAALSSHRQQSISQQHAHSTNATSSATPATPSTAAIKSPSFAHRTSRYSILGVPKPSRFLRASSQGAAYQSAIDARRLLDREARGTSFSSMSKAPSSSSASADASAADVLPTLKRNGGLSTVSHVSAQVDSPRKAWNVRDVWVTREQDMLKREEESHKARVKQLAKALRACSLIQATRSPQQQQQAGAGVSDEEVDGIVRSLRIRLDRLDVGHLNTLEHEGLKCSTAKQLLGMLQLLSSYEIADPPPHAQPPPTLEQVQHRIAQLQLSPELAEYVLFFVPPNDSTAHTHSHSPPPLPPRTHTFPTSPLAFSASSSSSAAPIHHRHHSRHFSHSHSRASFQPSHLLPHHADADAALSGSSSSSSSAASSGPSPLIRSRSDGPHVALVSSSTAAVAVSSPPLPSPSPSHAVLRSLTNYINRRQTQDLVQEQQLAVYMKKVGFDISALNLPDIEKQLGPPQPSTADLPSSHPTLPLLAVPSSSSSTSQLYHTSNHYHNRNHAPLLVHASSVPPASLALSSASASTSPLPVRSPTPAQLVSQSPPPLPSHAHSLPIILTPPQPSTADSHTSSHKDSVLPLHSASSASAAPLRAASSSSTTAFSFSPLRTGTSSAAAISASTPLPVPVSPSAPSVNDIRLNTARQVVTALQLLYEVQLYEDGEVEQICNKAAMEPATIAYLLEKHRDRRLRTLEEDQRRKKKLAILQAATLKAEKTATSTVAALIDSINKNQLVQQQQQPQFRLEVHTDGSSQHGDRLSRGSVEKEVEDKGGAGRAEKESGRDSVGSTVERELTELVTSAPLLSHAVQCDVLSAMKASHLSFKSPKQVLTSLALLYSTPLTDEQIELESERQGLSPVTAQFILQQRHSYQGMALLMEEMEYDQDRVQIEHRTGPASTAVSSPHLASRTRPFDSKHGLSVMQFDVQQEQTDYEEEEWGVEEVDLTLAGDRKQRAHVQPKSISLAQLSDSLNRVQLFEHDVLLNEEILIQSIHTHTNTHNAAASTSARSFQPSTMDLAVLQQMKEQQLTFSDPVQLITTLSLLHQSLPDEQVKIQAEQSGLKPALLHYVLSQERPIDDSWTWRQEDATLHPNSHARKVHRPLPTAATSMHAHADGGEAGQMEVEEMDVGVGEENEELTSADLAALITQYQLVKQPLSAHPALPVRPLHAAAVESAASAVAFDVSIVDASIFPLLSSHVDPFQSVQQLLTALHLLYADVSDADIAHSCQQNNIDNKTTAFLQKHSLRKQLNAQQHKHALLFAQTHSPAHAQFSYSTAAKQASRLSRPSVSRVSHVMQYSTENEDGVDGEGVQVVDSGAAAASTRRRKGSSPLYAKLLYTGSGGDEIGPEQLIEVRDNEETQKLTAGQLCMLLVEFPLLLLPASAVSEEEIEDACGSLGLDLSVVDREMVIMLFDRQCRFVSLPQLLQCLRLLYLDADSAAVQREASGGISPPFSEETLHFLSHYSLRQRKRRLERRYTRRLSPLHRIVYQQPQEWGDEQSMAVEEFDGEGAGQQQQQQLGDAGKPTAAHPIQSPEQLTALLNSLSLVLPSPSQSTASAAISLSEVAEAVSSAAVDLSRVHVEDVESLAANHVQFQSSKQVVLTLQLMYTDLPDDQLIIHCQQQQLPPNVVQYILTHSGARHAHSAFQQPTQRTRTQTPLEDEVFHPPEKGWRQRHKARFISHQLKIEDLSADFRASLLTVEADADADTGGDAEYAAERLEQLREARVVQLMQRAVDLHLFTAECVVSEAEFSALVRDLHVNIEEISGEYVELIRSRQRQRKEKRFSSVREMLECLIDVAMDVEEVAVDEGISEEHVIQAMRHPNTQLRRMLQPPPRSAGGRSSAGHFAGQLSSSPLPQSQHPEQQQQQQQHAHQHHSRHQSLSLSSPFRSPSHSKRRGVSDGRRYHSVLGHQRNASGSQTTPWMRLDADPTANPGLDNDALLSAVSAEDEEPHAEDREDAIAQLKDMIRHSGIITPPQLPSTRTLAHTRQHTQPPAHAHTQSSLLPPLPRTGERADHSPSIHLLTPSPSPPAMATPPPLPWQLTEHAHAAMRPPPLPTLPIPPPLPISTSAPSITDTHAVATTTSSTTAAPVSAGAGIAQSPPKSPLPPPLPLSALQWMAAAQTLAPSPSPAVVQLSPAPLAVSQRTLLPSPASASSSSSSSSSSISASSSTSDISPSPAAAAAAAPSPLAFPSAVATMDEESNAWDPCANYPFDSLYDVPRWLRLLSRFLAWRAVNAPELTFLSVETLFLFLDSPHCPVKDSHNAQQRRPAAEVSLAVDAQDRERNKDLERSPSHSSLTVTSIGRGNGAEQSSATHPSSLAAVLAAGGVASASEPDQSVSRGRVKALASSLNQVLAMNPPAPIAAFASASALSPASHRSGLSSPPPRPQTQQLREIEEQSDSEDEAPYPPRRSSWFACFSSSPRPQRAQPKKPRNLKQQSTANMLPSSHSSSAQSASASASASTSASASSSAVNSPAATLDARARTKGPPPLPHSISQPSQQPSSHTAPTLLPPQQKQQSACSIM